MLSSVSITKLNWFKCIYCSRVTDFPFTIGNAMFQTITKKESLQGNKQIEHLTLDAMKESETSSLKSYLSVAHSSVQTHKT